MLVSHERQKLIEAVCFFATHVEKLGKIKLFKLLYFLDFEHYRDTGRSVTGLDYSAWKMGPVPTDLFRELDNPQPDWAEKIRFGQRTVRGGKPMLSVTPVGEFDASHFSKRELRLLARLAAEFRTADAAEMVEATHLENLPWHQVYNVQKRDSAVIPYELAVRAQEAGAMKKVAAEHREVVEALRSR
ncbi:Panacea domain-containing protein [Ralstonia solanacearum]|uniref:Panacea domain-containing protein n=1 Tax=Ralstonia pseudosolanacearum TaxID=1310165 RepID=UPI001FF73180